MAGQPSLGSGQLFPGYIIALGPFLRPSAAPYGQTPVPRPVIQSSDCLYRGLFIRDFLMLRYGL
jgi:hypothetical protein